jgi:hypothetical protein
MSTRNKMISLRLSPEEFEQFRNVAYSHGIRSVSELVRAAITRLVRDPNRAADRGLEFRVSNLEGQIHLLAAELRRLQHHNPAPESNGFALQASAGEESVT